MDTQFPADLYLRPHSNPVADRHPTMDPQFVDRLAELPGVSGVSRFQAYEIQYQGLPITVAALDLSAPRTGRESGFISGRPPAVVLRDLSQPDTAVVSEPFTVKHHLTTGDFLTLPLGEQLVRLRIVDVFYDYGSERGLVMVGRPNLLHYLPAPAIAAAAVFLAPGADLETVRREVLTAAANHDVFVMSNRDLRQQAVRVFDQTFAITYALEAISVLVAVLGIAGALMSIVIDRRREFGLLRFLGASTGQIRKLILVEAGWLGFLSVVAGLVLGYVLSLVLIYVINKQSFGWTIRFHWPFAILAGALAVVYTATVLAGLYPARMAQRLNPIEVVHEE
jgi:putative ABC transport system permease protein